MRPRAVAPVATTGGSSPQNAAQFSFQRCKNSCFVMSASSGRSQGQSKRCRSPNSRVAAKATQTIDTPCANTGQTKPYAPWRRSGGGSRTSSPTIAGIGHWSATTMVRVLVHPLLPFARRRCCASSPAHALLVSIVPLPASVLAFRVCARGAVGVWWLQSRRRSWSRRFSRAPPMCGWAGGTPSTSRRWHSTTTRQARCAPRRCAVCASTMPETEYLKRRLCCGQGMRGPYYARGWMPSGSGRTTTA
eukprot:COSAG06_NODE_5384_length_3512_cov_2.522121_3_plen_247_part_00